MLNVIKMDLYRLMRSKAFKIGLILSAIICIGAAAASAGIVAIMKLAVEQDPTVAESMYVMEGMFPEVSWMFGVDLGTIIVRYSGMFSLVIATVICAVFVSEEQTSGFGKNYLGQLSNKGYSAVSKLIVTAIINLAILLVYTVVATGMGFLFFGKYITGVSAGNLALTMILRALMYIAINCIIVFLCLWTKSKSASMIVGVVFGVGAARMAYGVVTSALQLIVSRIFRNSKVTVPDLDGLIPDGVEHMLVENNFFENLQTDILVRVLVVAVIYISVFSIGSFLVVSKRDVK